MTDSLAMESASDLNIKSRFHHLNAQRLTKLLRRLKAKQADFLHLLPLLYHYNHAFLPGYISMETPCQVFNYRVDDTARECAIRYLGPHTHLPPNEGEAQIDAIYLMGSPGSVAFSPQSDLDIWLCVGASVDNAGLALIEAKAKKIDEWAATLGLEVHTFVMRSTTFAEKRHSPLSEESSGGLQHQLLLDEFYRSSLYIAGKLPRWWFSSAPENSPSISSDESFRLSETLDFGELTTPPAQELVTATLWHVYKAILHPSKSFVKLLLLATYTRCYPDIPWVSTRIRDAVLTGQTAPEATDAYVAMLHTIAAHSDETDSAARLTLAKRCLFLRGAQWLEERQKLRYGALIEEELRSIADLWGWSWDEAMLLVSQARQYRYAVRHARQLLNHIGACLETIRHLPYAELASLWYAQEDSSLISRVIYAHIMNGPAWLGKLPIDAHAVIAESSDSFHIDAYSARQDGRLRWHLYQQSYSAADGVLTRDVLADCSELAALVVWAIQNFFNGQRDTERVGMPASRVLEPARTLAGGDSIIALFAPLQKLLRTHEVGEVKLNSFHTRELVVACWVCFGIPQNLASMTGGVSSANSKAALSDYIEVVSVTSWQRVFVKSYQGRDAISRCLLDVLKVASPELSVSAWDFNRGDTKDKPLSAAFQDIYDSVLNTCHETGRCASLLARINEIYFLFSRTETDIHMDVARDHGELLSLLSQPRQEFHFTHIDKTAYDAINGTWQDHYDMERADRATVAGIPLPLLFSHNLGGIIQIYWLAAATGSWVFIFDEYGSFFCRHHSGSELDVLVSYVKFVRSFGHVGYMAELKAPPSIRTYRVCRNVAGSYAVETMNLAAASMAQASAKVVIGTDELGAMALSIGTADTDHSSGEFGPLRRNAEDAAHAYFLRQNAGVKRRVLVTDIDVIGCGSLRSLGFTSTLRALQLKSELDTALNARHALAECSAGDPSLAMIKLD